MSGALRRDRGTATIAIEDATGDTLVKLLTDRILRGPYPFHGRIVNKWVLLLVIVSSDSQDNHRAYVPFALLTFDGHAYELADPRAHKVQAWALDNSISPPFGLSREQAHTLHDNLVALEEKVARAKREILSKFKLAEAVQSRVTRAGRLHLKRKSSTGGSGGRRLERQRGEGHHGPTGLRHAVAPSLANAHRARIPYEAGSYRRAALYF
ncbi:hypothetical protein JCM11491_003647 [Sporobolomyces phaffii]